METITLKAEPRSAGRHANRELRLEQEVPAVMYGPGLEPKTIAVKARELHKALVAAGAGLITLEFGDGAPVRVLAREIQRNPVKHTFLHVDFLAVSMTERMRLEIPIVIEGTAPVLSSPDFVMVRAMDTIEIECLPTDIPNHLVADISKLQTIDDEVMSSDLVLPPGVKLVGDQERVVISVTHSRAGLEEEAAEAVSPDQVELVGKGKKEEEEEE